MIEERMLENLVAYVLQSSVVVAVALGALWMLRINAGGVRYAALRTTLLFALALPVLQPRVSSAPALSFPFTARQDVAPQPVTGAGAAVASSAAIGSSQNAAFWPSVTALVLIAGIVGRLLWLCAGLWRLRKLRRAGESAAGEHYSDLQKIIGTQAQLRYVAGLEQPLTFGFRRPIVLLPDRLRRMPAEIQRAVVAHELWHVRRLDWLWMVGEEAVRSALWFHPAIWALLSRIQMAREETVDDLVILTTGSRRSYLDALLAFADARPLFAVAAFARRRHLLQRMLTISKENVMSSKRLVASCAVLVFTVAATAWSVTAAFPLTGDQNPPRDSQQPPVRHEMVFVAASEAEMQEAIRREPKNPAHYRALAGYYLKAGDFDRAIGTLEALAQADPSNPQHHHLVGVFYHEKAVRDGTLTREQKMVYILSGIAAVERALALDPDYVEALVYKNILLRLQAMNTTDISQQRQLVAEADTLRSRAMELGKQRGSMSAPGDPMAPPPPPPPPPPVGPVDGVMPLQVGGTVPQPQKIRDVRPVYPLEAEVNRLSGIVLLELVIDTAGGVREARVVRSIPTLDEAALAAVRQWRYVPTVIEGVARPVVMTVSVNFSLQ